MDLLWLLTDIGELAIGIIALAIAFNKKKTVGYVLAIAYLLYVLSDVFRVLNIGTQSLWDILLQLAPIAA